MVYTQIGNFGNFTTNGIDESDPITYILDDNTIDNGFWHGSNNIGQNSHVSQVFAAERCSKNWDGICELASSNKNTAYAVNHMDGCNNPCSLGLTSGEILIKNTAKTKYHYNKGECIVEYEQFDPLVANSPMVPINKICKKPIYRVDSEKIDKDPVMNHILDKPTIALDVLAKIYHDMKNDNILYTLKDTRLGRFYQDNLHLFK